MEHRTSLSYLFFCSWMSFFNRVLSWLFSCSELNILRSILSCQLHALFVAEFLFLIQWSWRLVGVQSGCGNWKPKIVLLPKHGLEIPTGFNVHKVSLTVLLFGSGWTDLIFFKVLSLSGLLLENFIWIARSMQSSVYIDPLCACIGESFLQLLSNLFLWALEYVILRYFNCLPCF